MASTRSQPSRGGRTTRRLRASRLALFALILVPVVLGASYLIARETSLFAVRTIEISGVPAGLEAQIRTTLERFQGKSLVSLDAGSVERAVETLPAVRIAHVDRGFPHTLEVSVRPERAVAVVRRDDGAWLVSASGRILQTVDLGSLRPLPRVWLPHDSPLLAPGDALGENEGAAAIRALAVVPPGFPSHIVAARGTRDDLRVVLADGTELRLGDDVDLRLKFASAAAVLRDQESSSEPVLGYLDVSVPVRPVGEPKPQVQGTA